jgi:transposase-like protein
MRCPACGSASIRERSECTVQDYRRFRCDSCGKQFDERRADVLNRAHYPSDIIALMV